MEFVLRYWKYIGLIVLFLIIELFTVIFVHSWSNNTFKVEKSLYQVNEKKYNSTIDSLSKVVSNNQKKVESLDIKDNNLKQEQDKIITVYKTIQPKLDEKLHIIHNTPFDSLAMQISKHPRFYF